MHERQGARRELRQLPDGPAHARVETGIVEHVLGRDGWPDNVALGQRCIIAELGEQVAAQQRSGNLFVPNAGFPSPNHSFIAPHSQATKDLHGSVGPAFTSISMVAERTEVHRHNSTPISRTSGACF